MNTRRPITVLCGAGNRACSRLLGGRSSRNHVSPEGRSNSAPAGKPAAATIGCPTLALLALCASLALAQQPAPLDETEQLKRAFAEANNSPLEILHLVEKHLAQHPDSPLRRDLEVSAFRAASALKDDAATARWGEAALVSLPLDIPMLATVSHSLLSLNTKAAAERALIYARRSQDMVRQAQISPPPTNVSPLKWRNDINNRLSRALTEEARANAILGHAGAAIATARQAFDLYPNAYAARILATCLEQAGKPEEAIQWLANAFSMPDPEATDADRAADRTLLGEWQRMLKLTDEGLGAIILQAYDRDVAFLKARELKLHQGEPNPGKTNPLEFSLTSLDGKILDMSTLKGKVVVLDVWATYCFPCREQHPLYEEVKAKFKNNPSVTFLSINTDGDRQVVAPFVKAVNWAGPIYFEDGLSRLYNVDELPATILLDGKGKLFDHLKGYLKEHFVELLTERIQDALAAPAN